MSGNHEQKSMAEYTVGEWCELTGPVHTFDLIQNGVEVGGIRLPPKPKFPNRPWFSWVLLPDGVNGVTGHYATENEARSVVEAVTRFRDEVALHAPA